MGKFICKWRFERENSSVNGGLNGKIICKWSFING
jgi:hypothetical protein